MCSLVAQMLCLAEMLGKPVERGAIYHTLSRRRREVQLTDALKQTLHETLKALRLTLDLASAPPPTPQVERCDQCSLQDICQPSVFALDSPLGPQCATLFDDLADQDQAARAKMKTLLNTLYLTTPGCLRASRQRHPPRRGSSAKPGCACRCTTLAPWSRSVTRVLISPAAMMALAAAGKSLGHL